MLNICSCNSQGAPKTKEVVGGGCDGCELMYVDMPVQISSADTSIGWFEKGQKLLVTGRVFQSDGRTPAQNVVLYYWHTDSKGLYSNRNGLNMNARAHGYLRGWVQTNSKGEYSIFTIRPAPYPNNNLPAHIHISIKEPNIGNEYYADDITFDDDLLLLPYNKKYPPMNRGGSGLVRILVKDDLQIAEHDIILGLNIPNYPVWNTLETDSGLSIGLDQPSFTPFHAFGEDKGTRTCPVCKYGRYHGIIYFVGNKPSWPEIEKWLLFLEKEGLERGEYLKVYFVYGNDDSYKKEVRQKKLEKLGTDLNLKSVALTFVPSYADTISEVDLNKINPEVSNTFIIYKHRSIVDKFIDIAPIENNFTLIKESLDKTKGSFFDLQEVKHD